MQPRRIARELALLGSSQLPSSGTKLQQKSLEEILVAAVRALKEDVHDTLLEAGDELRRSHRLANDSELLLPPPLALLTEEGAPAPHPQDPRTRPKRERNNPPEPLSPAQALYSRIHQVQEQLQRLNHQLVEGDPLTATRRDLQELIQHSSASLQAATDYFRRLEQQLLSARQVLDEAMQLCESGINRVGVALSLPELLVLAQGQEVKDYALQLLMTLHDHRAALDERLQGALVGWQMQRLGRIEQDILRLAVVELEVLRSAPRQVAINEAVELAKKYGSEESPTFINGVLRRVVDSPAP